MSDMNQKVALINMPFGNPFLPVIGLSTLKSGLARHNIPARIYYLNLWFTEQLGYKSYINLIFSFNVLKLSGEWIFASAAWGKDVERDEKYIREVLQDAEQHLACQEQVEPFLQRCMDEIAWQRYKVVGFTSNNHQQLASFALARQLKQRYPDLFIVFFSANCRGEMGATMLDSFPFIDAVCLGEVDLVFPILTKRVLDDKPIGFLPGILHRQKTDKLPTDKAVPVELAPSVIDMDALPYPDYDDYFEMASTFIKQLKPYLQLCLESSRGCWWHQCTFCGLNGQTLNYRYKTMQRTLDEIMWLIERYGKHTRFFMTTDTIIPKDYFDSLLPKLRDLNLNIELFYENKSNLQKEQIELLQASGVRTIQAGIESISTPVLQLTHKGVTAIQNVQMLKWCRQFGVFVYWNFLMGFPGEKPEYYKNLDEMVYTISHLQAPLRRMFMRFDRFSQYVNNPTDFGVRNLRPVPAYRYIYPTLKEEDLNKIAYYFDGEFDGQDQMVDYTSSLCIAIDNWKQHEDEYALFSYIDGDRLYICDFRPCASEPVVILTGNQKMLYEECDGIRCHTDLKKYLSEHVGNSVGEKDLDDILIPLLERRLMLQEGNNYLALAVPLGYNYSPQKLSKAAFQSLINSI